jgi:hypothetical protein
MTNLLMLARFGGGSAFGFVLIIALVAVVALVLGNQSSPDKK